MNFACVFYTSFVHMVNSYVTIYLRENISKICRLVFVSRVICWRALEVSKVEGEVLF